MANGFKFSKCSNCGCSGGSTPVYPYAGVRLRDTCGVINVDPVTGNCTCQLIDVDVSSGSYNNGAGTSYQLNQRLVGGAFAGFTLDGSFALPGNCLSPTSAGCFATAFFNNRSPDTETFSPYHGVWNIPAIDTSCSAFNEQTVHYGTYPAHTITIYEKGTSPLLAEMPLPSPSRMAGNFIGSLIDHAKGGMEALSETDKASRLAICSACPAYRASDDRCAECGCFLSLKAGWKASKCPRNLWPL